MGEEIECLSGLSCDLPFHTRMLMSQSHCKGKLHGISVWNSALILFLFYFSFISFFSSGFWVNRWCSELIPGSAWAIWDAGDGIWLATCKASTLAWPYIIFLLIYSWVFSSLHSASPFIPAQRQPIKSNFQACFGSCKEMDGQTAASARLNAWGEWHINAKLGLARSSCH